MTVVSVLVADYEPPGGGALQLRFVPPRLETKEQLAVEHTWPATTLRES